MSQDALEAAAGLEESAFQEGYTAGFKHGQGHGRIEGRSLGKKTAFEIWEELGYYEGQAVFWRQALAGDEDAKAKRGSHSAQQLLDIIVQYPMVNAAVEDTDMAALLNLARSRYRVFCAHVGMRPRVQVATLSV